VPEALEALGLPQHEKKKQKKLPVWVGRLLRQKILTGPLDYLTELKLRGRKNYTPAEWGKLFGIIFASASFFESPAEKTVEDEKQLPQLRALREGIATKAGELIAHQFRRKKKKSPATRRRKGRRKLAKKETTLNSRVMVQIELGYNEGVRRVLDERGELVWDEQITYEICYAMWLFWPELKHFSKVREMHTWLMELTREKFSIKLVEKICREIGLKLRGRGNPAKVILPGLAPG